MGVFSNDKAALKGVSKGNLEAYRYLFDNHFPDLCNFLLLYFSDKGLAEEIALDIFAYIWEKRGHIRIKSSFKGFLFAAAKNRAVSHYRKKQKDLFSSLEIENLTLPDPGSSQQAIEDKELRQIINQAIEGLPPKSRMIYKMAWEDDLSQKEIARELGLSPKTVENHVSIALRKLRETLKPYYNQIFIFLMISLFFHKL
jgi:RNA polymerase sigma-70 factor (ECF subfamily)